MLAPATALLEMAAEPHSSRPTAADARRAIDWVEALREHDGWLRKVVLHRLGEPDAVDDVMQNVAMAVLNSRDLPAEWSRVAPWLYRVAVRQCLMHRRTAGRRRRFHDRLADTTVGQTTVDHDPLQWLLGCERREAVAAALARLNDIDRDLLILKHSENWTYRQLAEHLGVSESSIEHRLLQARKRLRKELIAASVLESNACSIP